MKKRILGSLTLWLMAVLSVAAIASLAIDTAGRQVTSGRVLASLPRDLAAATSPAPTVVTPLRAPLHSSSQSAPPREMHGTSPARRPLPPRTARPWPTTGPDRPRMPVTSTYATPGGRVRVRCAGSRITLGGGFAQPAADWSVQVADDGPDQVKVVFAWGGRWVQQVVATCADGSPRFARSQFQVDPGRGRRVDDRSRSLFSRSIG